MRLLWALVVLVGVAVGVAKRKVGVSRLEEIPKPPLKTGEELWTSAVKGDACEGEEELQLCERGLLFTATALSEVRSGGELEVLVSLEKLLLPRVTFDVSLHVGGAKQRNAQTYVEDHEEWGEEEKVLVREEVTLEVNELRRVVLRVGDLPWKIAFLVVAALPEGHSESGRQSYMRINKISLDTEVFVQTDKSEYATGDTVNYRALVVDGNVDKTPKFAQVILGGESSSKEIRLPWVEVPKSGVVMGNFTYDGTTDVDMRVTSNVTSSDSSLASSMGVQIYERTINFEPAQSMSVKFEGLHDVYFSQPRLNGRVKLTSPEGNPLEGNCNVTIQRPHWEITAFTNELAERSVAVGLAGGEFEFDVGEELRAVREGAGEYDTLGVRAKCSHLQSGSVADAHKDIHLYTSLFKVRVVRVRSVRRGNSSHPQTTVALLFRVERRDGGSVAEEEPKKGLHVKLLLSKNNLARLRPSATEFSLPIPPSGKVGLEFQVDATPTFRRQDKVGLEVGDTETKAPLNKPSLSESSIIHVTPVDPPRLIRRGDVVRFHVRPCLPYDNVNAILSSKKAIYSSQRFSFSPEDDYLDEVIELTIPQNVTEGSLLLTVNGLSKDPYYRYNKAGRASVKINVIPSSGPQEIFAVDQLDVDMSTKVTFRLEGMLADSVVSLQAAKVESLEEKFEDPFKCQEDRNAMELKNTENRIRDDSPDTLLSWNVLVSPNFAVYEDFSSHRHPQLVFFDVDRKISAEGNGSITVTRTFDRLTEFGTYVVSAATFNSKSGRTVIPNSLVFKILPPPVTLSVSVLPPVVLGETVDIIGYVKNNLATPFKGHVTLQSGEDWSTGVREELVEIKPNSFKILKMQVTPVKIGELVVSLQSNISSRLTATQKVKVNPSN